MLALPVERLVGNSSAKSNSSSSPNANSQSHNISRGQGLSGHPHHHNHRSSASPDSSTMSDCSSCRSSPSSSPVKVSPNNSALIAPGSSPRSTSPREPKSHLTDLSLNDTGNGSVNNNRKSISPSPSPQSSPSIIPLESRAKSPSEDVALLPIPNANSRKRRRSSSSCDSGSRRSRSNSPGGGGGHDLSRKGMIMTTTIKREETSPRNSPSCHSCCCQKSPRREDDEELSSSLARRVGNKSNNNEDCNNSTTKIESGEEDGDAGLSECANVSRSNNKINGNDRTSAIPYYHNHQHQPHDQEYSGDHHHNHLHFPHFNHNNTRHQQRPEEMREQPGSRSKVNNSNKGLPHNGDDNNESGGGGHPSLTVDNGLSSPGSISSTSSSSGRPPSRPPSTASTASSSCFSSVLSLSTSTTTGRSPFHHYNNSLHYPLHNGLNHHHHHHHSHFLKFSIEDILRPDFGKVRGNNNNSIITIPNNGVKSTVNTPPISNHPRLQQNGSGDSLPSKKLPPQAHPTPSQDARPNSRESSFKYHSDDSNSSSTSRQTEVVDETKVNPKVPEGPLLWPAWVYCTRYSDRPSSGPRSRRIRKKEKDSAEVEEKRPRTAFTAEQLSRLKQEFDENRYLTEKRRQDLAQDLKLHENQIKIWFQNKRAKLKKSNGQRNGLAMQLMAQGLYNHSTIPVDEDEEMMLC